MQKAINIVLFLLIVTGLFYYFTGDKFLVYSENMINKYIYQTNISDGTTSTGSIDNDQANIDEPDDYNTSIDTGEFDQIDFGGGSTGEYTSYIVRDDIVDSTQDIYISNKDFVGLFVYYQKRLAAGQSVNVDKFLNTVLNLPTDKINYNIYINILTKLHSSSKLTDSEFAYYKTFGNIMQLKFDEFNHDINLLNYSGLNQEKIDFIKSIYKSNDIYKAYKSPPKYYLIALMGSNLITNGYYEPARRLATEILKINEGYILTNQIMAYYNFIMGKNNYSEQFLSKLIQIDQINGDFYKFLLGVTYYESEKYSEAIGILQNINKSDYNTNIHKYLLSSYLHIGDWSNAKSAIQAMIKDNEMDIYDYQTVWQYLFYPNRTYEDGYFANPDKYIYYQNDKDFANQLVDYCNSYISQNHINTNICNIGKYGQQLAKSTNTGNIESVVNNITNGNLGVDYIYARVGDYYTYIGRKDLAKPYYLQSYKSSDDIQYKNKLKDKVIELFKQ